MTSETRLFAPAKVNLTLHVTGQRADGYHLIDSLVVFADLGDELVITPAQTTTLAVTGAFAQGVPADPRNLVWRAAELAGITADIQLEKNLPHGAGIGGGSSDAAAVLRHADHSDGAAQLGADVPVCLRSTAQRMQGIGEVLTPVAGLPSLAAVLINPKVHVPTPVVFQALALRDNPPMADVPPPQTSLQEWIGWLQSQRNDLQEPAIRLAPEIGDVLTALTATQGTMLARISGSGSSCFALFADMTQARVAARRLAADHRDWWVRAVTLNTATA